MDLLLLAVGLLARLEHGAKDGEKNIKIHTTAGIR